MKILKIFIVICFYYSCDNTDSTANTPIDLEFYSSIIFEEIERTFFVHLPQNYSQNNSFPLIFVMHGGGLLGYEGVEGQSQLSELSDQEGFIVVYPEGIRTLGFRTWNAGECCPSATLLETNDVGFINTLLDVMKEEYAVNSKRVYAAGFSNGGQLAYRLANEYPNRYAAVSSVAGVLQDFPYQPTRNVPMIHFHSYQDTTAPYYGGQSDAPNISIDFPSVEETLLSIADHYNCNVIKQTIFSNSQTYDKFRYSDCNGEGLIELYVSHDGGHSWPGGQAFSGVEITNHFNASELMWEFFKKYQLQ